MNRIIIIAIACVAFILFAICYFLSNPALLDSTQQTSPQHKNIHPKDVSSPFGKGTADDREARFNYQKQRLQNPATDKIPSNMRKRELNYAQGLPQKTYSSRTQVWNSRGPNNVGGRTRALALDVNGEDTILAGGVTGGMWRSTDGGQSFTKTTSPDQFHSVSCIAQDTQQGHTDTWYYGTGEYYAIVSQASRSNRMSGNGIYKTTDGGQSWQPLASTQSNTPTTLYEQSGFDFVWEIVTDPTIDTQDVVYAAVVNGIYKSVDGGQSWDPVLGLDTTAVNNRSDFTDIAITSDGVLYASVSGGSNAKGLWRSEDGDNWTNIAPTAWPANDSRRTEIAIDPNNEDRIYFLGETPGHGKFGHMLWRYEYQSGNGSGSGGQWTNLSQNLPEYPCQVFYDFEFGNFKTQNSYDMCIAVKPGNSDVVFLGGTNVYRSTDGFTSDSNHSWIGGYRCDPQDPSDYVYPTHHPDQHAYAFLPSDPDKMITANDGGLFITHNNMADSVKWQSLNNGYVTSQFYTVAVERSSTSDFLVGGMQDNGTYFTNSTDPAASWQSVLYGDGGYAAIPNGRDNYYLSWQTGKTYKCNITDQGQVQGITRIDPKGGSDHLFINPFLLNPADSNQMFYSAGNELWLNDSLTSIPITGNETDAINMGWDKIASFGFGLNNITSFGMSKADPSTIYFGTNNSQLYKVDSLVSGNYTKTQLTPQNFPNGYVSSIAVNHEDPSELLLTFSNYEVKSIFHSSDSGQTWTHVSGNLEENQDGSGDGPSVVWAAILNQPDTTVYFAGTSVGLFSTGELDSTNTVWQQEGANTIGNVVVNMVKTRQKDGLIAAATHGTGIYTAKFGEQPTRAARSQQNTAGTLTIMPNPVNDRARIHFSNQQEQTLTFSIHAIDGKTSQTIHKKDYNEGEKSFAWIPSEQLTNGIYLLVGKTSKGIIYQKKIVLTDQ